MQGARGGVNPQRAIDVHASIATIGRGETQANLRSARGVGCGQTEAVAALEAFVQQHLGIGSEVGVLAKGSGAKSALNEVDRVVRRIERGGGIARRIRSHELTFDLDAVQIQVPLITEHVQPGRLAFAGNNGSK